MLAFLLGQDINSRAIHNFQPKPSLISLFTFYFILNTIMVRLTRNSKTPNRVAGCTPSHHDTMPYSPSPAPRVTRGPNAADREKARANAMQSRKGAEVKAKVRSCLPRLGITSIPADDLLVCYPVSLDF